MTKLTELYYNSFDLACIIHSQDIGTKTAGIMLGKIWNNDNMYLTPYYRTNLRALYLDVYYWTDYLCDKMVIDKEFPSIQMDFQSLGKKAEEIVFVTDFFDIDLFFKMKRLQILYFNGHNYVRIKLRTLLRAYGYKRRTQELLKYFYNCLHFYHLQTYLRGREKCDIGEIGPDDMITIRVI